MNKTRRLLDDKLSSLFVLFKKRGTISQKGDEG